MFSPVEHLRIVYDENMIRTRVRELAKEIDSLYGDEPLVIVCVLKGAFLFFSDLVRALTISPELDFVRLASYGEGMKVGALCPSPRILSFPLRANMFSSLKIS